jgi:phosphomannomutase
MESAKEMNYKIKFGTDGWREIIADNYTVENVLRVAEASANWFMKNHQSPTLTLGYDCRFGGKMFAEFTARMLAKKGVKVLLSNCFVSTPMISLANFVLKTDGGIIITASHNPPEYNGFKLKASYGGPILPEIIEEIEQMIPENSSGNLPELKDLIASGQVVYHDFEQLYIDRVKEGFNLNKILDITDELIFDAMYGASQNVIRKLFPNAHLLHCSLNPGFEGVAPEPILKNLRLLSETIEKTPGINIGWATDGDADRIGFFDGKGRFVDSHHLILLVTNYLYHYKGMRGKIVKSFSVSSKVDMLAKKLGLESVTTKIGFKYICKHMIEEDVLIGAEESGGIAIKGHIPERDGIWIGLVLLEYMAETGKTVDELVKDMYELVGPFAVERYDLHLLEDKKQEIIAKCKDGSFKEFGNYKVLRTEDLDGFKFHFPGDEWVMIRPSGTEPVLRIYAEAFDSKTAFKILDTVKETILV